MFKPGLVTRTTAAALDSAAAVSSALGEQVGYLTDEPGLSHERLDMESWRSYTSSVIDAVHYARRRGVVVLVATQPYISHRHRRQQAALSKALAARFANDPGVRYVNLGDLIDMRDRSLAYDGMHLVPRANRAVAEQILPHVLAVTE